MGNDADIYLGHDELSGPLTAPHSAVRFEPVLSPSERLTLLLLSGLIAITGVVFLCWIVWPAESNRAGWIGVTIVSLMVVVEAIRLFQSAVLAYFMARSRDAVPQRPAHNFRVAIMTTMVPGKEPWEIIETTLMAMGSVRPAGSMVDIWLLDEGNDPDVRRNCALIGVNHYSRKGKPELNTEAGRFKAKTKHGNHNSWLFEHGADYDVVAQMDPDHVPVASFLERTLGYFNDADVAYVVAPQVYGNLMRNWIAKGSAVLAYVFHGVIQRGGNGLGAPLLIGTNHLYRVSAWQQIGGYDDWKVEDHATAMQVLSAQNPKSGNMWKGVYTRDILNVGEGPTTFFDWYQQQLRWAGGIWEIMLSLSPRLFKDLRWQQRLAFGMLQSFYPSVAIAWVCSIAMTALYVVTGYASEKNLVIWMILWTLSISSTMTLFFWLRRFNLAGHERDEYGWCGIFLMLMTIPTYVAGMFQSLFRIKTGYGVTAKGRLAVKQGGVKTFRAPLTCAAISAALFALSTFAPWASHFWSLRFWLIFVLVWCLAPLVIHYVVLKREWQETQDVEPGAEPATLPGETRAIANVVARRVARAAGMNTAWSPIPTWSTDVSSWSILVGGTPDEAFLPEVPIRDRRWRRHDGVRAGRQIANDDGRPDQPRSGSVPARIRPVHQDSA